MDSQLYVAPELQAEAVTADMTAVEQIVYNLADNAAKYACFDGSVLKVELAREKRFLVIRVEDEGKGISDSLKGKLFRPFPDLRRRLPENSRAWGWGWLYPGNWREAWAETCAWKKVPTDAALPSGFPFPGHEGTGGPVPEKQNSLNQPSFRF